MTEDLEAKPATSYQDIAREYACALQRVARAYEANAHEQRDLLQEIHLALWRSLPSFDGRAALRTWVFRVAHNVAVSHVMRASRARLEYCVQIDDLEDTVGGVDVARDAEHHDVLGQMAVLVRKLRAADRQVILLYLEGFEHEEIAAIAGMSRENAGTKVHRIKRALIRALEKGGYHAAR